MRVELRGITKRFPGVVANEDVNLVVEPGQVHALLGENGAGKSTLMNVLFGLYRQTEGEVLLDGEPASFSSPADAIDAGIGMVHQHFMLVPVFTVAENVMLGVEPTSAPGVLDRDAARRRVLELSARHGLDVDPDAMVEDLPVGVQQRVEILKALYREADCLILDEPTAVLTPTEIDDMLGIIRRLADEGRSVIFISHKLREVRAIADTITILRRGRVVGTTTPDESDEQELATAMVGRDVQLVVDRSAASPTDVVLRVSDLRVRDDRDQLAVADVSFDVRAGEIVAIAGVQGNGQSELVSGIVGLRRPTAGRVELDGTDVTGANPARMVELGVAHVPEDRQRDGLISSFPVSDNLVLNLTGRAPYSRGIRMDRRAIRENAERLVQDFDIRTSSIDAAVGTLSGGNQQKVIVGREMSHTERLLVLSQPTRGLDVGSIQYIHHRIVQARDQGLAVLLNSSELDEVLALADRVIVMYRGGVIGEVSGDEATRDSVGMLMAGARA
ncbi:MAG TPA: ABC transporter ATP-binding protein [Acidimicrobiales bacterium]|nr:ABC transporter ATP-binding protein [Acidimicrobiales bacterium]